jgi:hypothetical protein
MSDGCKEQMVTKIIEVKKLEFHKKIRNSMLRAELHSVNNKYILIALLRIFIHQ